MQIEPLTTEAPDFDAEAHAYFVRGVRIPSVTTIISEARYIDTRFFNEGARDLGRRVHAACEEIDWGENPELTSDVAPYVAAYRRFLSEHRVQWQYIERPLYHPADFFAGTPDRVGLVDGEPAVIDIKRGGLYSSYEVQLAAYASLFKDPCGFRLFDLMLKNVRAGTYQLLEVPREDFLNNLNDFRGALIVLRRRQRKGLAA